MLLQYCASYDIKGISSLCTAELISVIANTFIGVSCLIVFAVTQKLETRLRFRWPLHVFTWVFMILNGVCVVFNSVTWLLVAPGKGFVIVSQLLSLQTLVTVPLCYHSLEKFWSTRWRKHNILNIYNLCFCHLPWNYHILPHIPMFDTHQVAGLPCGVLHPSGSE